MLLSLVPLIILVALGYFSLRSAKVSVKTIQDLGQITFKVLIPFYLFKSIATSDLSGTLSISVFLTFYCGIFLVYLASFMWMHKTQRYKPNSAAVFALGATYSNTIIVGLPVLISVIGPDVAAIVFIIISFHSAMLFTLTSILAMTQQAERFNLLRLIDGLMTNPLLIGIFLGLLFSWFELAMPSVILQTLELLTMPALTLALYILGANLCQYRLQGHYQQVVIASILKLVVLPFIVWLCANYLFNLDPRLVLILVILTASPIGVNAYFVACQHKVQQAVVAGSVVVSTVLSAITIPVWLLFLTH